MIDPKFLLQTGPVLSTEKYACRLSGYEYAECAYDAIETLNVEQHHTHSVPVGSVEFVRKYCDHVGLKLPEESITYFPGVEKFMQRTMRRTTLGEAGAGEFVKPVGVKKFTGDMKKLLRPMSPLTEVWAGPYVPFESEFRFYIHVINLNAHVVGWARYDNCDVVNPDPDMDYVFDIANEVRKNLGPNAFSVDIGWRGDLGRYDLVELNDAWALGLYNNSDPQSAPPTPTDYAEMLISRWFQILFCNVL